VGNQRLTAWAMARPFKHVAKYCMKLQTYFINRCVVTVFNKDILSL
jgi:hypothetical protein